MNWISAPFTCVAGAFEAQPSWVYTAGLVVLPWKGRGMGGGWHLALNVSWCACSTKCKLAYLVKCLSLDFGSGHD